MEKIYDNVHLLYPPKKKMEYKISWFPNKKKYYVSTTITYIFNYYYYVQYYKFYIFS